MAKSIGFELTKLNDIDQVRHVARTDLQRWWRECLHLSALIKLWRLRQRQRRELAQLSDFMLKDIGVSRADAQKEANKPFWKP